MSSLTFHCMFQFIPSPFRTTTSHTCSTPFPLQELPHRGPDLHRVFLRFPKANPGMPSTLFHRPLNPSFKLLILSYIVVFTCLFSYLIARSLGAGPFLVISQCMALYILLGLCRPWKDPLALRRERRAKATEQLVKM